MRIAKSMCRLICGFSLQLASVYFSTEIFVAQSTIFFWMQTGFTILLMFYTPVNKTKRYSYLERYAHLPLASIAYYIVRRKVYPRLLLALVCVSNALGQLVACESLVYFYPDLRESDVRSLRFCSIVFGFPVCLASAVASIPGSISFHEIVDVPVEIAIVNYFIGHVTGTSSIIYPGLVIPTLYKNAKTPSIMDVLPALLVIPLCFIQDYGVFAFMDLFLVFGLLIFTSVRVDQMYASIVGFCCSAIMLVSTICGYGPFMFALRGAPFRHVVISSQLCYAAMTTCSSLVSVVFGKLRSSEESEKRSRENMEDMVNRQSLVFFRITHDIRSNVAIIDSLTDEMSCKLKGNSALHLIDVENYIKTMQVSTLLATKLLKDLVDTFRFGNGKESPMQMPRHEISIHDLLETTSRFAQILVNSKKKDIEVHVEISGHKILSTVPSKEAEFVFFSDRSSLDQILVNLVENSVKYTGQGHIKISADIVSKFRLEIRVEDTGIGIPSDEIPKLFEPFYRCKNAVSYGPGTGLGLNNVLNVVKTIGGELLVSSVEGNGSCFKVSLPIGSPQLYRGSCSRISSLNVLIVDDSAIVRNLCSRYVVDMGCTVHAVENVESAMSHLDTGDHLEYGMVICDFYMTGLTGGDFVDLIRKDKVTGLDKNVPVIICTGDDSVEILWKKVVKISKPFGASSVKNATEHVLSDDPLLLSGSLI